MGNHTNNKQTHNTTQINHPKFKFHNRDLHEQQKSFDFIATSIPLEHESALAQWQNQLHRISNINDQNLLLPKNYSYVKNTLCGSSGVLHLQFDNYPYLLINEIENRQIVNKRFDETQIWYLLYVLVWSCSQFYPYANKIGDIRPQNIFINQMGQIKVVCKYSWPCELNNYQKTLLQNQPTFLSPQQLHECKLARAKPSSDPQKGQSFSIGITILQSLLLHRMEKLYDRSNLQFQNNLLTKYIQDIFKLQYYSEQQGMSKRYSKSLLCIIASLCEINPKNRMTPSQCYNFLKDYQIDILNLRKVDIPLPKCSNKYEQLFFKHNKTDQKNFTKPFSKQKVTNLTPIKTIYHSQQSRPAFQSTSSPVQNYIPFKVPQTPLIHQNQISYQTISSYKHPIIRKPFTTGRISSLQKQPCIINQSPQKLIPNIRIITHQNSLGSIRKDIQQPPIINKFQNHITNNNFVTAFLHPRQAIVNINDIPGINQQKSIINGRFGRFHHDAPKPQGDFSKGNSKAEIFRLLKGPVTTSSVSFQNSKAFKEQNKDYVIQETTSEEANLKSLTNPLNFKENSKLSDPSSSQSQEQLSPYFRSKDNFLKTIDDKVAKSQNMFPSY